MRDKLPSNPCNVERIIINLDSNFGRGTHWVAIKKNNNHAFYFDSYGDLPPPPEIVKYLGRAVCIQFNANKSFLSPIILPSIFFTIFFPNYLT